MGLREIFLGGEGYGGVKDYFNDALALGERGVSKMLGVGDALNYATTRPAQLGYTDDHRGSGDALRHVLLAAELQRTHPYLARPLLWGHENITNWMQGQLPEEQQQDTYNNMLGTIIGRQTSTRQQAETQALNLLRGGLTKILPPIQSYYGPTQ